MTRAVAGPDRDARAPVEGFGDDGMWYEGENYHLFALRGQLHGDGLGAAGRAWTCSRTSASPRAWPRAPGARRSRALPDLTFPARKDSRFGVSLAQPMYLELWEVGLARLGDPASDSGAGSRALYARAGARAQTFDSYLHEAGEPARRPRRAPARISPGGRCSRWRPRCRSGAEPWAPGPTLLEGQGLAVLRDGARYASLECGRFGGGPRAPRPAASHPARRRGALARRSRAPDRTWSAISSGIARRSRTTPRGSTAAPSRPATRSARLSAVAGEAGAGPAGATAN